MSKTYMPIALFLGAVFAIVATVFPADAAPNKPPAGYCEVTVCNKLERYTLDPTSWVKDWYGKTCTTQLVKQEDAVVDKILSSDSRMLQGTFNPTKKSVTRVKEVIACTPADTSK